MSIELKTKDLSPAEVSFLKWQYGFEDDDDPFERSLWHTIMRAWESDHAARFADRPGTQHLQRLGAAKAYPDEVSLFIQFKADDSGAFWEDLIRRAGLSDRRQRKFAPVIERRRRAEARR
jgi:hypothetical protein